MATPPYARSLVSCAKRLKVSPTPSRQPTHLQTRNVQQQRLPWHRDRPATIELNSNPQTAIPLATEEGESEEAYDDFPEFMSKITADARGAVLPVRDSTTTLPLEVQAELKNLRLPRAVQATYLAPLRRTPTHGIPAADLQIRSYSVRNLEFMADFAMRAAYFLGLPAKGPVPLPRITNRYTVPRSNFVHKKSQENFERVTLRRLVQVQDGHPETVSLWLGFLQKYQYYGVGMKANVWEHGGLEVAKDLDAEAERISEKLGEKFELFGRRKDLSEGKQREQEMESMVHKEFFKGGWGAFGPLGGSQSTPSANSRAEKLMVGMQTELGEAEAEERKVGG